MLNYLKKLDRRLYSFSGFRSFIETEMMSTFHWMIASLDSETSGHADPFDVDIVNIYASFVNSIYNEGGNLTDYVKQYVQNAAHPVRFPLSQKRIARFIAANALLK